MPTPPVSEGVVLDGKYQLIRLLSEGGMGQVFVAEHTFLKKHVAVKVLHGALAHLPDVTARFEQEARTTSHIEHDNVVRVMDFGRTPEGALYLVMELLDGRSLAARIENRERMEPPKAIDIIRQILLGLEAAHAKGVIHRDLKPENVILIEQPDGSDKVKIVDFGIAKLQRDASVRLTTTGAVMGTPLYMAPEQARGMPDLDQRVDVHAVGVMLYELLAGRTPYVGDNYNVLLFEIMTGRPTQIRELLPALDPELAPIVMKAFAPNRDERFTTARQLRERLESYLEVKKAGHTELRLDLPPEIGSMSTSARRDKVPSLELLPLDHLHVGIPGVDVATPAPAAAPQLELAPPPSEAPQRQRTPAPPRERDPFAPAEVLEDQRIELDVPKVAPVAPPTVSGPVVAELNAYKRQHQATRVPTTAIVLVLLALGAGAFAYVRGKATGRLPRVMAPSNARLTVQGLPPKAEVYLDEAQTFLNPIEVTRSQVKHTMRIEAPGYRTKVLTVVADDDHTIDGKLEREPKKRLPRVP